MSQCVKSFLEVDFIGHASLWFKINQQLRKCMHSFVLNCVCSFRFIALSIGSHAHWFLRIFQAFHKHCLNLPVSRRSAKLWHKKCHTDLPGSCTYESMPAVYSLCGTELVFSNNKGYIV